MPAPYRNIWIIIGLASGISLVAKYYVEPTDPQLPYAEKVGLGTQSNADRSSDELKLPLSTERKADQLKVTVSQNALAIENIRTQNIDSEIRLAFKSAMKTVLAKAKESDLQNTYSIVPPLSEAGEVSAPPHVADILQDASDANSSKSKSIRTGMTTTDLNMRQGPGPSYLLLQTLSRGIQIEIFEEEAGWLHVREKTKNQEGWVNRRYISLNVN